MIGNREDLGLFDGRLEGFEVGFDVGLFDIDGLAVGFDEEGLEEGVGVGGGLHAVGL
jgi:hypothetical protein